MRCYPGNEIRNVLHSELTCSTGRAEGAVITLGLEKAELSSAFRFRFFEDANVLC